MDTLELGLGLHISGLGSATMSVSYSHPTSLIGCWWATCTGIESFHNV